MFKLVFTGLIFLVIFGNVSLQGAAPFTHLYLGNKWAETRGLRGEERAEFISGNLYPDIRYLGENLRIETHAVGVTLEQIDATKNPFMKGILLHSYIDEKREEMVLAWNIYPLVMEFADGHQATLLKLVEDEILYNRELAFETIQNYRFESAQKSGIQVSSETLQKWQFYLTKYLAKRPSLVLGQLVEQKIPFMDVQVPTIKKWNRILLSLASKPELISYVRKLDQTFDELFRN